MPDSTTICVTGASGFLGSQIMRQGLASGLSMRALDRRSLDAATDADSRTADILDASSLVPAFGGVQAVIHAAGIAHVFDNADSIADRFFETNVSGTENVIKACASAGVRRAVLISTIAVYGSSSPPWDESVRCAPQGPYACSKRIAEQRAIELAGSADISLTILRLATLYGQGDPGNIVRLIKLIDRGHFVWIGDGTNRKTLLHRVDAANACLLAAVGRSDTCSVFNVVGGSHSMATIVACITQSLGRQVPGWRLPSAFGGLLVRTLGRTRGFPQSLATSMRKWLSDDHYTGAAFGRAFGFVPGISLERGIEEEVRWYRGEQHD